MRRLVKWRNAFAHGHCVDRPTKSLRHNHLIKPPAYLRVKSELSNTIQMVRSFLEVEGFLSSVSPNAHTKGHRLGEYRDIEELIEKLSKYKILGNGTVYNISHPT